MFESESGVLRISTSKDFNEVKEFKDDIVKVIIEDNSNINKIPDKTFKDCKNLRDVATGKNPNMVIGQDAFRGCVKLRSINLPGVTKIEDDAFNGCGALKMATFGKDITIDDIGTGAFSGCKIISVTIPSGKKDGKEFINQVTKKLPRVYYPAKKKS